MRFQSNLGAVVRRALGADSLERVKERRPLWKARVCPRRRLSSLSSCIPRWSEGNRSMAVRSKVVTDRRRAGDISFNTSSESSLTSAPQQPAGVVVLSMSVQWARWLPESESEI